MDVTTEDAKVYHKASASVKYIHQAISDELRSPSTAIICGSGLNGLSDSVQPHPRFEIPYGDIPHFPQSTVQGHLGKLLFGFLGDQRHPVVLMVGRVHFYEGHSIQDIAFPIRVLKLLGVRQLIVTNAAGALNPEYAVGDIVILSDHLNLAGLAGIHPLRGPNIDEFGIRFPPLSDAYDLELRRLAFKIWSSSGPAFKGRTIHEGTYAFVGGPSYETRAECRMLKSLGADLVGMSTVPEVIVARHSGLRVLAISLVTNKAVLEPALAGNAVSIRAMSRSDLDKLSEAGKADHQEVLDTGKAAANDMQSLVSLLVQQLE